MLAELWALGFFSYLFLREEAGHGGWAALGGAVTLLSGYGFFSLTTYACTTILASQFASLYVIWTLDKRTSFWNLTLLTMALTLIMTSGNLVYGFSACLTIAFGFFYRCGSIRSPWKLLGYEFQTLALSVLFAVTLSLPRIVGFASSLRGSSRVGGATYPLAVTGHLSDVLAATRMFAAEIFGVSFKDSIEAFRRMWEARGGASVHIHGFEYVGVAPFLLLLLGVMWPGKRGTFWRWMLVIIAAWMAVIRPVEDIAWLLLYPMVHAIIPKLLLLAPLITVATYAGLHLEEHVRDMPGSVQARALPLACLTALAAAALTYGYMRPEHQTLLIPVSWMILGTAGYLCANSGVTEDGTRKWHSLGLAGAAVLLVASMGPKVLGASQPLLQLVWFNALSNLIGVGMVALAVSVATRNGKHYIGPKTLALSVCLTLLASAGLSWRGPMIEAHYGLLATFSLLRFAVASCLLLDLLRWWRSGALPRSSILPIIGILTIVDLLPFNRQHQFLITAPYRRTQRLYPSLVGDSASSTTPSQPQLLRDPGFEASTLATPTQASGWRVGGPRDWLKIESTAPGLFGDRLAALENVGSGTVFFLEEVRDPGIRAGQPYVFGLWVKTQREATISLILADETQASSMDYQLPAELWHWLWIVHRPAKDGVLRPHIGLPPGARAQLDGALLLEANSVASSWATPDAPYAPVNMPRQPGAFYGPSTRELARYRVNYPYRLLTGHPGGLQANIHQLAGIRTVGGVNSVRGEALSRLVASFGEAHSFGTGAMSSDLRSDRLLDILGVGFEIEKTGTALFRPSARRRFMLYQDFQIADSPERTLDILAQPDFLPLQTIVLDSHPGFSATKNEALGVDPVGGNGLDQIVLDLAEADSGIMLFGDMYHPGWRATIDGRRAEVIRVEHSFMGVVIPPGSHRLTLFFWPPLLQSCLHLMVAFLCLLLPVAVVFCRLTKSRREASR